jgi:adenosylcobyric acid synthase
MEGDACALVNISDGKSEADGLYYGNVFGSYIHGIFDNSQTASLLVRALCSLKGIDADFLNDKPGEDAKKGQYDLLADGFRKSVDMDRIYQILEEGI